MLPSDLFQQLTMKFQLVCFEDLTDILLEHGTIFQLLKSLHRYDYQDQERLVFYTAYEPDQSQLDHVQRAASRVDISNFFILIVCPFDVTDKLRKSNQKFGNDGTLIQSLVMPLEQTQPFVTSRLFPVDTLCALPFVQAHVDADGSVRPCCKFQQSVGDLNESDLEHIWYDEKIHWIRQEMRQGHRPAACSVCWENEDAGTTSHRQLAWHKYGAELDYGWLDNVQIRDITWAPSSLCNFACRICWPGSSTSVAVEEIKFSANPQTIAEIKHLMSITNNSIIPEKILNAVADFPDLEHLHLLGGEPFLWPGLPRLIDTLITNNQAHKMTLEFNTNCSVYPKDKIELIIENFHAVQILLSVDNVGTRFEIERGGRWPLILNNIKKFAALKSTSCDITLAVTVNLQNLLYLDDVIEFAKDLSVPILWWYLEDPAFLSIDRATDTVKQLVKQLYQAHDDPELRSLARRVANSVGSDGREFLTWCHKIDSRRGQKFAESHAEIYAAMGG